MPIRITCEFCSAKLNIRPDKLGQPLKCPSCRNMISVSSDAAKHHASASAQSDSTASDETHGDTEGFNFAEEFDLEGLVDESASAPTDLSRMPPARKPTSRAQKRKATPPTMEAPASTSKRRNYCTVCKKQLDPGVRYCIGCGHNNFDAEAAAVDAHLKIQTRMERLTASLGMARILKIFSRMFR